jgi:hypothetical protein
MAVAAGSDGGGASRGLAAWLTAWLAAAVGLVALTAWAASAGGGGEAEATHDSPAVVEHVEGSDRAWVGMSEDAVDRIGLEVAPVRRAAGAAGGLTVPYAALVYGADGTTWVYAADGSGLRFRREVVVVHSAGAGRAVLLEGPRPGTLVAGRGSAELYGSEFEVGH